MQIICAKTGVYDGYGDAELETECNPIIEGTAATSIAGKLDPYLEDSKKKLDEYSKAMVEAKTGSKNSILKKNELKEELVVDMEELTIAVNYFAMGNLSILNETNMKLVSQKKSPPVKMEKPIGLTGKPTGIPGQVYLSVLEAVGASSYMFQYSATLPTEDTVWESRGSTTKDYLFTGLPSKTTGYFRVVAVGRRKQQIAGDVIAITIM